MKKFIFPLLLSLSVLSCNKKGSSESSDNKGNTSKQSSSNHDGTEAKQALIEYSNEKATELLQKKNDTLYVTNFFATWCKPCVVEIPHFKEKMDELKGKPVKFTYININVKEEWDTDVEQFVDEMGIRNQTILLDPQKLNDDFFNANFDSWVGEFIPYTMLRKGDKVKELSGSVSKEELEKQIAAFQ